MIANSFDTTDLWMIVTILLLLGVLMVLAVAEMGLSRISRPKAAAMVDKGHKSGPALLRLVGEPERWVNPVLLMTNICQTVQATLTGLVAGHLFGVPGVIIGVVLNVVVFFVLAEAVPKTYAILHPERAALFTARPTAALVAFPPIRMISKGLIAFTNVIMPGKGLEKGPFVSEQELLGIVEAAADDDVIEHEERQLIESIIEFGDTVAREVMVPRPDVVFLEADQAVSAALDIAIERGYSRFPVLGDGEDDVVGVAYTKDLMKVEREGLGQHMVGDSVRPVRFIPENKPVSRVMREMQAEKFHLAMVLDEYGAIAGLVTLEDCLEELVGDIVDEYDKEEAEVQRLDDGDYLVDGGASVDDLNSLLDLDIPNDDWDSIGGFVFGTLGHVPAQGEHVDLDGWRFTAHQVEGRRIRRVRVSVVQDWEHDSVERAPDATGAPSAAPMAPADTSSADA